MGQGRKKCFQSEKRANRHRSVHYEVESQDTTSTVSHSGIGAADRADSMPLRYHRRGQTPLPTIQCRPRHDSLVDYMKLPTVFTGSLPTKQVMIESVDHVDSIPLVSTTVIPKIPSMDCLIVSVE